MTKREFEQRRHMLNTLASLGFTPDEADKLRRISMTLRRWYELECGDGNGHIERDEKTGTPRYFNAKARYLGANDPRCWHVVPDREAGAQKRLAAIMAKHAPLSAYVQTDPRGAALYILRPDDVPAGADPNSYYSRGICVY